MDKEKLKVSLQLSALITLALSGVCAYLVSNYPHIWQVLLGLAVVLGAGSVWASRADLKHTLSRRATRYGLNSLFMSLVVFAIVVVINLIAANHDQKIDITKNKLHTLSDQTVKILKGLERDVKLRAFISPMQKQEYQNIFSKYGYHSKHIVPEFVDVDKDPLSVRKFDIKQAGTIIVESDTRSAKVDNLTSAEDPKLEEKLTNAIISVEKGSKKKIYFVSGHLERLLGDTSREGYSQMRDNLSAGRYNVEELNLLEKDKIPADAEIVLIPGPKKDFMPQEITVLEDYLKGGGKVLLMLEPDSTKTLLPLLAKYGVDWHPKKAVLERNRLQQLAGGNPLTPIVTSYDTGHEITKDAKQMSIFPVATPIERSEKVPDGVTVTTLFATTPKSQEVEFQGDRVAINEKVDRKGPIHLAVAVSGKGKAKEDKKEEKPDAKKDAAAADEKAPEYRLVVVGDADFASNQLKDFGINSDLFQNMLSWLAKEEDLISIRPKAADSSEFDITEQRMRVINFATIAILPFTMFLSGILVWASRRRK